MSSTQLSTQKSVLPPNFKLEWYYGEDGFPRTRPFGISHYGMAMNGGFIGTLGFREAVARELVALFVKTFGYTYNEYFIMNNTLPEGDEVVWIRARCKPKFLPGTQLEEGTKKPEVKKLPVAPDVIDI